MGNKRFFKGIHTIIGSICLLMGPLLLFPFEVGKAADQYISHRFTTKSGLPQNTVYDIAQDKEGHIWIGTDDGVVRFDGVKFETFNKANNRHIKNNSITTLMKAGDGTLWMGTFGGGVTLYDYKKRTFSSYTTQNGLPHDFIWTIIRDRRENIWLGTVGGGLIRFKDNHFQTFNTQDGLSDTVVNAIFEDRNGCLWIGTENGLNELVFQNSIPEFELNVYTSGDGIADNNIMALFQDSRGVLWIGTINGLTAMKGNHVATYTTRHGLSNNMVRAIHEDREGSLWIATDGGLNRIRERGRLPGNEIKIEPFGTGDEQFPNSLMSIFEDREGNLWIGSSGSGLNILHQRKLLSFTKEDGLTRDYIKALFQDRTGTLWIGTNGGGLNLLKDRKILSYTTKDGLAGNFINAFCTDDDNNIWIGTGKGLSLYKYKEGTFHTFTKEDGLTTSNAAEAVNVLYEDHAGNIWIGTYGSGLHRFNKRDKTFFTFTARDGLSNNFILCMAEDKDHNLWIGTHKGLNRLEGSAFKTYTRKDGLSNDTIYDIYPDSRGILWLGTNGGGLNRFDPRQGTFTHYTTESGLFNNVIYRIIKDNKGKFWMSSNKGIFTVSPRQLNYMARGSRSYVNCKYFGEEDGMKSAVCTGGFQPAGVKTKDGLLWFPTIKGLVALDPQSITFNTVEPPVLIERIVVDGVTHRSHMSYMAHLPMKMDKPLKLPANTSTIKISFTALSFTAPRKVKFSYRLKGYEDKWTETHSREQVVYSDLPAGHYTFEITACNNDGVWAARRTTAVFIIRAPFHQTFGFYFLVAVVLTIGGLWLYRLPERRLKRKVAEEQKYQASTLTVPKTRTYSQKLLDVMETEKPYLDPELKSARLAQAVGISKKHLSQVINQQFNMNFKNFINKYRVEEAKKKLLDPKEQDFVLMKIALDVGFNSKSVFNEAFKKFTGMSPSEYRKKMK